MTRPTGSNQSFAWRMEKPSTTPEDYGNTHVGNGSVVQGLRVHQLDSRNRVRDALVEFGSWPRHYGRSCDTTTSPEAELMARMSAIHQRGVAAVVVSCGDERFVKPLLALGLSADPVGSRPNGIGSAIRDPRPCEAIN